MKEKTGLKTKEKLLYAAYDILHEYPVSGFSLSKLAKKVGVSKPAIFRYFVSKEALLKAVDDDFFSKLSLLLKGFITGKDCADIKEKSLEILRFFLEPPGHNFYYLLGIVTSVHDSESYFLNRLYSYGLCVKNFLGLQQKNGNLTVIDKDVFYEYAYAHISLLMFMAFYVDQRDRKHEPTPSIEEFAQKLYDMLRNGFDCFEDITEQRIGELKNVFVSPNTDNVFDRVFVALSKVLEHNGFKTLTIEAVADELGMAKSSLYNYFATKKDMIYKIMNKEIDNLVQTIRANASFARTRTELLTIYLYTILYYLLNRPYSVTIFRWLRFNDIEKLVLSKTKMSYTSELFHGIKLPDLGFNLGADAFVSWVMSLPVTLAIHGKIYGLTLEDMDTWIHNVIGYLRNGIDIFKIISCQITATTEDL